MSVTDDVSQAPMDALKAVASLNALRMSVTFDVSHLPMWLYLASALVESSSQSTTAALSSERPSGKKNLSVPSHV